MKLKILHSCRIHIEGRLLILDPNQIVDLCDTDALHLLNKDMAQLLHSSDDSSSVGEGRFENKMLGIKYKKRRGRYKKEKEVKL